MTWTTTPGFQDAVRALNGMFEGTMPAGDIDRIVAVVMMVTRPHVQAEFLADLSDDLALEAGGHTVDSWILDQTSYNIREHLDGR